MQDFIPHFLLDLKALEVLELELKQLKKIFVKSTQIF